MNIIKNYYNQVLKYDFINKFYYGKIDKIPKIKKIILNFNCKNFEVKKIATVALTLELISSKKSVITRSKKISINLKLRKGHPIGCKVILTGKHLENFLFKLLNKIWPNLKNFDGLMQYVRSKNSFSFSLKDLVNFDELNSNFYLFSNLPTLNIVIIYNTKNNKELLFFLYSLKIPFLY